MANQGRYKWEKSMKERCKLTADALIGIIDEFNLYGYSVQVDFNEDEQINTIDFVNDKYEVKAFIAYGLTYPLNVVVYDNRGCVEVDYTME